MWVVIKMYLTYFQNIGSISGSWLLMFLYYAYMLSRQHPDTTKEVWNNHE